MEKTIEEPMVITNIDGFKIILICTLMMIGFAGAFFLLLSWI